MTPTKQTVYVPCGNQVTHFKVKCDPDDEGNYMQCNVKKEENKYILSEEQIIKLISDAFKKSFNVKYQSSSEEHIKQLEIIKEQYIKQILNK